MKKPKKSKSRMPMFTFAVNIIVRVGVAIYFSIVHPFGPFDDSI